MTSEDRPAAPPDDEAEIAAMSAVSRALRELGDDERRRVLEWAVKRFAAPTGGHLSSAGEGLLLPALIGTADGDQAPGFEHFAELVNRVRPRTDVERALLASYWVQEHEGRRGFVSTEVNERLRETSAPIAHMADAMAALQARRPALVIQIRKSGRTRQARKTYQVTAEGVAAVRAAIQARGFGANGPEG
jgi:hypothetical protein